MSQIKKLDKNYEEYREEFISQLEHFETRGVNLDEPARNTIKVFNIEGIDFNIKSFKTPNAVNKIVYRFFRKSKAERSFYYAKILEQKGIGTPAPVGYAEETSVFAFKNSFYISRQLPYDLTYRKLIKDTSYPQREEILRAFTRFTYNLHENEVLFLDHSPGNTLIQLNDGEYRFFLVDLNRMLFKPLNETERFKNFSRLTPDKEMVRIMSDEYAGLIGKSPEYVFEKMWFFTSQFQKRFQRKKRIKRKLKLKKS